MENYRQYESRKHTIKGLVYMLLYYAYTKPREREEIYYLLTAETRIISSVDFEQILISFTIHFSPNSHHIELRSIYDKLRLKDKKQPVAEKDKIQRKIQTILAAYIKEMAKIPGNEWLSGIFNSGAVDYIQTLS